MYQAQPAFNELNSNSAPMLNQQLPGISSDRTLYHTESLGASGSIDDFLCDDRQRLISIHAFMSESDESSLFRPQQNSDHGPNDSSTMFSHQSGVMATEKHPKQNSKSSATEATPSKNEKKGSGCSTGTTSKRKTPTILTEAEREEKRKSKNREYQRRFREKKMRLEFQSLARLQSIPHPAATDRGSVSTRFAPDCHPQWIPLRRRPDY
jgi:hypothetical protein